jgi:hypothetical protein
MTETALIQGSMRGGAQKVSIPLEGKVPLGDIPSFRNEF